MLNVTLGLRAAFLVASMMLCVGFFRLAWQYARSVIGPRRWPATTVTKFGFALWLAAFGATLANTNHILGALTGAEPQLTVADLPTLLGLLFMTVGYFMHVLSKIEAMGGDARRFWIYGGGGIVLVGVLVALVPRFL